MPKIEIDIQGASDFLQEALKRYYEDAYWLKDRSLREERNALLSNSGEVFAEPRVEVLPTYRVAEEPLELVMKSHLLERGYPLVNEGLFSKPYQHQIEAFSAFSDGKNVVVGTGTGSGKTESFLFPIVASLIRESANWQQPKLSQSPWYERDGSEFVSQRAAESRPAAVRSLVLYPMNALVEDQIIRLRKLFCSPAAEEWFEKENRGNRFYFGRYTGATPGTRTSATANSSAKKRLASEMRSIKRLSKKFEQESKKYSEERYFLPHPSTAEMHTRWDMQHQPPDILITNYSMLSIALGRRDEAQIFVKTKEWLDQSTENVFTLVLDETHMYRGTAGSEVAYLLRRLYHELGLKERPKQLRIIATSASIDNSPLGREFLEELFGVDGETFEFISAGSNEDVSDKQRIYINAYRDAGQSEATGIKSLSSSLFPDLPQELSERKFAEASHQMSSESNPDVRLRGHLFAQTVMGMWACSDPSCSLLAEDSQGRGIGRVYSTSRYTCDCGARVLELLYCEPCGESFLGGFVHVQDGQTFLSSQPSIDDEMSFQSEIRNAKDYRVYWPQIQRRPVQEKWQHSGGQIAVDFKKVSFDATTGKTLITGRTSQVSGWVASFESTTIDLKTLPGLPTRCPACGTDREDRMRAGKYAAGHSKVLRSPIRTQGVGFQRVNQVLTTALRRYIAINSDNPNPKIVAFSDSRQGAAKLSAEFGITSYLDLVRAVIVAYTQGGSTSEELELLIQRAQETPKDEDTFHSLSDFVRGNSPQLSKEITKVFYQDGDTSEILEKIRKTESRPKRLSEIRELISESLIKLGVSPAGPLASIERETLRRLIDTDNRKFFDRAHLSNEDQLQLDELEKLLTQQTIKTIFAAGHRDIESIGIGFVGPAGEVGIEGFSRETSLQILSSAIRIQGKRRRTESFQQSYSTPIAGQTKKYLKRVFENASVGAVYEDFERSVFAIIAPSADQVLRLGQLVVHAVGEGASRWKCDVCATTHLHQSGGFCTVCLSELPQDANEQIDVNEEQSYFRWIASEGFESLKFVTEELTGQTETEEALTRQLRFQDVFLDSSETKLTDSIDLLSVTTTMEAGVDIGALQAVVMANMPPERHNYQQRVGRAGRRGNHISFALTICRTTRSHDRYYFNNLHEITRGVPPQPKLDMGTEEIIRRSLLSAVLSSFFKEQNDIVHDPGRNVHGEWGTIAEWEQSAAELLTDFYSRLRDKRDNWIDIARSLVLFTKFEGRECELVDSVLREFEAKLSSVIGEAVCEDLSEALTSAGLLPMYGFPTKVRKLYLSRPNASGERVIERDAKIALAEFAPSNELVKDKAIHRSIGVAAYERVDGFFKPSDPFAYFLDLVECRTCGSVTENTQGQPVSCSICPEVRAEFLNEFIAGEPRGYRTTWKSRNYENLDEVFVPSRPPRIEVGAPTEEKKLHNSELAIADGISLQLNDNGGRYYNFAHPRNVEGEIHKDGLIESSAFRGTPRDMFPHRLSIEDKLKYENIALVTRMNTAMFVIKPRSSMQIARLSLNSKGVYGAFISLGYLLRVSAHALLEIGLNELEVVVQQQVDSTGELAGSILLADTLENGSGYAKMLYHDVENVVVKARDYLDNIDEAHGGVSCDSSCYKCLQDYSNSKYHGYLDWRSAEEVLQILETGQFELGKWNTEIKRHLERLAAKVAGNVVEYAEFPALLSRDQQVCIVICSPLLDLEIIREEVAIASGLPAQSIKVISRTVLAASPFSVLSDFNALVDSK